MVKWDELKKLSQGGAEPRGVTVQAADGRLYFLSEEDAKRTAIPASRLFEAYAQLRRTAPPVRGSRRDPCAWAKRWLDTHSPNSSRWRRICLTYFEACV